MMRTTVLCIAICLLGCFSATAQADWDPIDGHKMHYPQFPDPFGWDVDITRGFVSDDWQCSQTGPVSDIHFWLSWQGGQVGLIDRIWARIWSDVPDPDGTGPLFSHPGTMLWDRQFSASEFTIRDPEFGEQGWYTPYPGMVNVVPPIDHTEYYQINIENILNPFPQTLDTIYWLELHIIPDESTPNTFAGWKTSLDHWNDDAVYEDQQVFFELFDPVLTEPMVSLDMAFVITPEPTTLSLLVLSSLALLLSRCRPTERC